MQIETKRMKMSFGPELCVSFTRALTFTLERNNQTNKQKHHGKSFWLNGKNQIGTHFSAQVENNITQISTSHFAFFLLLVVNQALLHGLHYHFKIAFAVVNAVGACYIPF